MVIHTALSPVMAPTSPRAFARFCQEKRIWLDLASVAHPQSNGQVERSNALVLSGIKAQLIEPLLRSPGCWLDEIPAVLWSLRTTPNRSTGYTPFFLVYGAEAVLPTDIEHDSPRVALYTESEAKEARENDLGTRIGIVRINHISAESPPLS